MQAPSVTLTCEHCQRRKVKCDKKDPCGPCHTANLSCVPVQRPRRPRGRKAAGNEKTSELKARVTRLEKLVKDLSAASGTLESPVTAILPLTPSWSASESSEGVSAYNPEVNTSAAGANEMGHIDGIRAGVASSFWTSLSRAVSGLREILDGSSEDEDESLSHKPNSSRPPDQAEYLHTSIFPSILHSLSWRTTVLFPQDLKPVLLEIYHDRIDSIFKVGHWPSIRDQLTDQGLDIKTSSAETLQSAVFFMAICSLTENECTQYFLQDKASCTRMSRQDTELCLATANLLNTTSVTVLQAFVIYLAALRTCESLQSSWTLLALAVRLATVQGIDTTADSPRGPLDREVRRRLWCTIGLLDVQTALDRGARPLLQNEDFPQMPLEVDDQELLSGGAPITTKQTHFTDMTFSIVTYEAMSLYRRLCQPPKDSNSTQVDWKDKINALERFKTRCQRPYTAIHQSHGLLENFTQAVSQGITVTMELLLRRPLYKIPPDWMPPADDFDVLNVATEVLERGELKVTYVAFQKWQWFSWLKWFALAVVLAELCGKQHPGTDRAWAAVDACYERYARSIADSANGSLWRPIGKLFTRAKMVREQRSLSPNCTLGRTGRSSLLTAHLEHPSNGHEKCVDLMDSAMSAAQLEEGALAWINWEMFVDDMNYTTATISDA